MDETPRKGTKAYLQLQVNQLETTVKQMSTLVSRAALSYGLGKSFGGDRDLYTALGYTLLPKFTDYLNIYERDGIGTRIVDAISDETWRKHPILYTGKETPDEDDPGPLQDDFKKFADEFDLWATFNNLDRWAGISRFSLMYLGLPGNPDEEVKPTDKLLYVSVHDEGDAEIDETSIVKDTEDPRFGLPDRFRISLGGGKNYIPVHHSRVILYKEGKDRNSDYPRVYGVPRLKNVLNYIQDLQKVVGGGSEAFWLLIHRGLALTAKEGMTLPDPDSQEYKDMVDEIDEYQHGIRRIMRLIGLDVKDLGAEPVDSKGQFGVLISCIAGSERIPQRLLIGSEMGKLASTQDDANWADYIDWRRRNMAEPYILRPFLRKADDLGFFNLPDNFNVYWPSLFQLTELEQADVASRIATSMNQASGGAPESIMPPEEFAKRLPGEWRYVPTPEEIAQREADKAAADAKQQTPPPDQSQPDLTQILGKLPNGGKIDQTQLNEAIRRANPGWFNDGHDEVEIDTTPFEEEVLEDGDG